MDLDKNVLTKFCSANVAYDSGIEIQKKKNNNKNKNKKSEPRQELNLLGQMRQAKRALIFY